MARTRPGEPYPEGTRVHHRGAIHSRRHPEHRDDGLAGGWGIVQRSVRQGDGSYEYEVLRDRGIAGEDVRNDPGRGRVTWWGSHHIDESLPPGESGPCLAVTHDEVDCSHLPAAERCLACKSGEELAAQ